MQTGLSVKAPSFFGGTSADVAAKLKHMQVQEELEGADEETAIREKTESWQLSVEGIKKILKICRSSEDQQDFWSVFEDVVLHRVMVQQTEPRDHRLSLSTDLRRLELYVALSDGPELEEVSTTLLNELQLPQVEIAAGLLQMQKAFDTCSDSRPDSWNRPTGVGLWCRLDGMDSQAPTIDVGFRIEVAKNEFRGQLEWSGIDMLLPPSEEKDAVLDFAMNETPQVPVTCITGSLLPMEPELGIEFELPSGPNLAIHGLLFFKTLSFAMPADDVLHAIVSSRPWGGCVQIAFGPHGLRRVGLRLLRPESWRVDELAQGLNKDNRKKDIARCSKALAASQHRFFEYAAEGDGYSVSVGYCR